MDLLLKLKLGRDNLTTNEAKACDAIMNDMLLVQHNSLAELSREIGVTKTCILRFCQKLGYSGYSEFKFDLINYVNSHDESGETENNSIVTIENLYTDCIKEIHHMVSEDNVEQLMRNIVNARKVYLVGLMNSYVSALQLRYALLMYGIDASAIAGVDELKAYNMCLSKEDLLIVYSVSAKKEIMDKVNELKEQDHFKTALITMNSVSEYKEKMDHIIILPSVNTSRKSLLQNIPIFTIFNEILIDFINKIRNV